MWSAVLAPGFPHSAQMVALPSLRMVRLLALYMGSLYGDVMGLMLLAPSHARLLSCVFQSWGFVFPTVQSK